MRSTVKSPIAKLLIEAVLTVFHRFSNRFSNYVMSLLHSAIESAQTDRSGSGFGNFTDQTMTTGTFEQTSLDWQMQQLQQQMGEWLERLFMATPDPDWQPPQQVSAGVFWLLVGGLVGWGGWQAYRRLLPALVLYWRSLQQGASRSVDAAEAADPSAAEWVQRSRLAQQQGNYREACRALYLAALQRLNDQALIPQEPSRTDGEYLRILQSFDHLQPYTVLIQTHERLCFSAAPISAEQFDRCWQAYRQLDPP